MTMYDLCRKHSDSYWNQSFLTLLIRTLRYSNTSPVAEFKVMFWGVETPTQQQNNACLLILSSLSFSSPLQTQQAAEYYEQLMINI